jgi:hypothetical protein
MQSDEYKLGWNLRKFDKNDEMVNLKLSIVGEKMTLSPKNDDYLYSFTVLITKSTSAWVM